MTTTKTTYPTESGCPLRNKLWKQLCDLAVVFAGLCCTVKLFAPSVFHSITLTMFLQRNEVETGGIPFICDFSENYSIIQNEVQVFIGTMITHFFDNF